MTSAFSGVLVGLAGVLGLLIGSFLNVVIHRVPQGLSLVSPGSACPACAEPVRPRDNIPVLSWLLLRGRCRDCGEAIAGRYPLVELGTGVAFAAVALHFGWTPYLGVALVLTGSGIALALIDLERRRLPFPITGFAAVGTACFLLLDALAHGPDPAPRALLSAALWLLVYGAIWLLTAGRGMGLGDVALAPVLGLALGWLGWGPSVVGLLAGFVVGAVVGIALLAVGAAGRRARIPHGPFLLAGAAIGMVLGQPIWRTYLTLVGLG